MTTWAAVLALTLAVFALLWWRARPIRAGWQIAAAALALGLAGYAWQGQPMLAAAPAGALADADAPARAGLLALREAMALRFTPAASYLRLADAAGARGEHEVAVAYLRGGLRAYPRDSDLWAAVGVQLMLADRLAVSPASRLAMDRARALRRGNPVPDYFEALAALRDDDADAGLALLDAALAKGERAGRWRPLVMAQRAAVAQGQRPASAAGQASGQGRR